MVKVHVPFNTEAGNTDVSKGATKLKDLTGKRVALLSNKKANAKELLLETGELLKEQYSISEYKVFEKENASYPAPEFLIEQIRKERYDACVVALGD